MSFNWSDAIFAARGCAACMLALSVPFLAWWGVRRLRPTAERFCPGPARRWSHVFRVWGVLISRGCGYPLVGLSLREDGAVVCPECGRRVRAKEGRRRASPWRPGRFATALSVGAVLAWIAPMAKTSSWQRHVPVTVLIGVKRTLGPAMPTRLGRELDRRMWKTPLTGWQRDWVLPTLAADLRRDGVAGNARKAIAHLKAMGEPGRLQLERCLRSGDAQERRLAAEALRDLHAPWERIGHKDGTIRGLVGEPSDDLLRVTLEFLGHERPGWCMGIAHARDPYAFLGLFPERVTPMLAAGMTSDDKGGEGGRGIDSGARRWRR